MEMGSRQALRLKLLLRDVAPRKRFRDPHSGKILWEAEAPYQQGPGEIVRVSPQGTSEVVYRGPVVAALGVGPGNSLFVADRHEKQIFILTQDGKRAEFASFTDGDIPRSLGFAPVSPEARRAGVAGDLFVVTIKNGTWLVNEVLRVSGPFNDLTRPR